MLAAAQRRTLPPTRAGAFEGDLRAGARRCNLSSLLHTLAALQRSLPARRERPPAQVAQAAPHASAERSFAQSACLLAQPACASDARRRLPLPTGPRPCPSGANRPACLVAVPSCCRCLAAGNISHSPLQPR